MGPCHMKVPRSKGNLRNTSDFQWTPWCLFCASLVRHKALQAIQSAIHINCNHLTMHKHDVCSEKAIYHISWNHGHPFELASWLAATHCLPSRPQKTKGRWPLEPGTSAENTWRFAQGPMKVGRLTPKRKGNDRLPSSHFSEVKRSFGEGRVKILQLSSDHVTPVGWVIYGYIGDEILPSCLTANSSSTCKLSKSIHLFGMMLCLAHLNLPRDYDLFEEVQHDAIFVIVFWPYIIDKNLQNALKSIQISMWWTHSKMVLHDIPQVYAVCSRNKNKPEVLALLLSGPASVVLFLLTIKDVPFTICFVFRVESSPGKASNLRQPMYFS